MNDSLVVKSRPGAVFPCTVTAPPHEPIVATTSGSAVALAANATR